MIGSGGGGSSFDIFSYGDCEKGRHTNIEILILTARRSERIIPKYVAIPHYTCQVSHKEFLAYILQFFGTPPPQQPPNISFIFYF